METQEQMIERQVQRAATGTLIIEVKDAYGLMDEWAKIKAAEFVEWALLRAARMGRNEWATGIINSEKRYTTDELYDLFLKENSIHTHPELLKQKV
jgi:hypothetical protein